MWGSSQEAVFTACALTGTENMKNGDYMAAFSYFQKAADRGYSSTVQRGLVSRAWLEGTPGTPGRYTHLLLPPGSWPVLHCP